MAAFCEVQFTGLEEVLDYLTKLKASVAQSVIRQAVRYGATPILQVARSEARVESGLLRKSLGVKVKSYSNGSVIAVIGPRKGFRQEVGIVGGRAVRGKRAMNKARRTLVRNPVKYAHLVELGTKRSRKFPFLRPAWTNAKGLALERIKEKIVELAIKKRYG